MVCGHEVVTEVAALMRRLDEVIVEAEADAERGERRLVVRREIRTDHVRLYVRVGLRGVPDSRYAARALSLVDITIDEDYRSRGILHLTMAWLEQRRVFDGIYIENVFNDRLVAFLQRRGYQSFPASVAPIAGSWWRRHPPTTPPA